MTAEDALVQLKPMNEAMRALGMDMGRLWLPEGECFDKTLVTILSRTAYRRRNGSSAGVCRDGSVELIADLPPTILRAFLAHEATHLRQISKILGRSGPRAGRYAHRCYLASLCEVEAKIIEVAAAKLYQPNITPDDYCSTRCSSRRRKPGPPGRRADYRDVIEAVFPLADRVLTETSRDEEYCNEWTAPIEMVKDAWDVLESRWWPNGNTPHWFRWDPQALDCLDNPKMLANSLMWWTVIPKDIEPFSWHGPCRAHHAFAGFDIQAPVRDVTLDMWLLACPDHRDEWDITNSVGQNSIYHDDPNAQLVHRLQWDHDPKILRSTRELKPSHEHLAVMWYEAPDQFNEGGWYQFAAYDLKR